MLFNSYEFIFAFLPITFFVYFHLNSKRLTIASKGFLVFSSLYFYSWWNIAYLPLILASMLFNYIIGNSLNKKDEENKKSFSKKSILIFGIVANVLLLGYFKYADFFIENFNLLSSSNVNFLYLLLPLAISFFTFQEIAYLVDSYRGETKEYDFLNYSLFVTFFPQLIAGPIVHHKEMMFQFANVRNKVKNYWLESLHLFFTYSETIFLKMSGFYNIFEIRSEDSKRINPIIDSDYNQMKFDCNVFSISRSNGKQIIKCTDEDGILMGNQNISNIETKDDKKYTLNNKVIYIINNFIHKIKNF